MAIESSNRSKKIRWGILSTGGIAHEFARRTLQTPGAELVAVGSRTAESAETFGAQFNIPHRHGSYEALAGDPEVDIIYIATPHNFHYANARLCLEAGKPVLVEKAFTLNAAQAADLIAIARQKRLFLMEAMWTRFLPVMAKVRELVQGGAIGELRIVKADLGFRADYRPDWRLLNLNLAGGALLDVGCYVVSFASMLLGNPIQVSGISHIGQTGVDEQSAILLGYPEGRMAVLNCAIRTDLARDGWVFGTEGSLYLSPFFCWTSHIILKTSGGVEKHFRFRKIGFEFEIAEAMRCLRAGLVESPAMPLDESLSIMRTLDTLRQQAGLRYPEER
jgi:dihydrodiol dehydrogenase / D-xylose 1-dehydrogenase (NADP)